MVTIPAVTPLTRPVLPTVAMPGLLLLHVPPEGVPVSGKGLPIQARPLPAIDAAGLTVIVLCAEHPMRV